LQVSGTLLKLKLGLQVLGTLLKLKLGLQVLGTLLKLKLGLEVGEQPTWTNQTLYLLDLTDEPHPRFLVQAHILSTGGDALMADGCSNGSFCKGGLVGVF
jgi:hypothetical protein